MYTVRGGARCAAVFQTFCVLRRCVLICIALRVYGDAHRTCLTAEQWANAEGDDAAAADTVAPKKGGLFIVHAPPDGEFELGLVHITNSSVKLCDVDDEKSVPCVEALWFQRASASRCQRTWPSSPGFTWWPRPKGPKNSKHGQPQWIRTDSLLVEVKLSDLTKGARDEDKRLVTPRLTGAFMTKLRILARQRRLTVGEEEGEEEAEEEGEGEEEQVPHARPFAPCRF